MAHKKGGVLQKTEEIVLEKAWGKVYAGTEVSAGQF